MRIVYIKGYIFWEITKWHESFKDKIYCIGYLNIVKNLTSITQKENGKYYALH